MNNKKYRINRFQALGVMLIYLFVAVAHIFFLTSENLTANNAHSSIFKRKIGIAHSNVLVERAAKATIKETVKNRVAEVPLIYLNYLATNVHAKLPGVTSDFLDSRDCLKSRHLYLTYCVFRI